MGVSRSARTIAVVTLAVTLGACSASVGGRPVLSVGFIVREPPPVRVEVVTDRPSEEHIWIKGHWASNGNDYAWVPGRWVKLEGGHKEWVEGRWEHEDRGWHYIDGHWR
jgi:hypothetical protein